MSDINEIIAPPVECLENGCIAKSNKCYGCSYCYYPWFSFAPVAKNREICYNAERLLEKETDNCVK